MCIRHIDKVKQNIKTGYKVCIRNKVTGFLYNIYRDIDWVGDTELNTATRINNICYSTIENRTVGYHFWASFCSAEKHLMHTGKIMGLSKDEEIVIVRVNTRKVINSGYNGTINECSYETIIEAADLYIHPFIYARRGKYDKKGTCKYL